MNRFLVFLSLLFMLSCHNDSANHKANYAENKGKDSIISNKSVNTNGSYNRDAIWIYRFDSTAHLYKPVKLRAVLNDTLRPQIIEHINNLSWPKVHVNYLRTSGDTVFISIPESNYLTQQMGTAGAEEFIVSTTFSFTELNGIKFVSFDFEEGDHAVPGVYDRTSWDLKLK